MVPNKRQSWDSTSRNLPYENNQGCLKTFIYKEICSYMICNRKGLMNKKPNIRGSVK